MDPFVLLAPFLLFPIVALLRFIGCDLYQGGVMVSLEVLPSDAKLKPKALQTFTAYVNNRPVGVEWKTSYGTFVDSSQYQAPAKFVNANDVVIAIFRESPSSLPVVGSATVTLLP